ncbi:MAG: hypothetical protein GF411_14800, partial [Candidatus Lokiarchaeota archaeon]|nr:hypothetical protein [Candidatus Lokiarchaeota archaeon]
SSSSSSSSYSSSSSSYSSSSSSSSSSSYSSSSSSSSYSSSSSSSSSSSYSSSSSSSSYSSSSSRSSSSSYSSSSSSSSLSSSSSSSSSSTTSVGPTLEGALFDSGSSEYITRTPSSAGSLTTLTISFWVKRGALGSTQYLVGAGTGSTAESVIFFNSSDQLVVYKYTGSYTYHYVTNAVFRDPGAHMHIVVTFDTTNGTAGDRVKITVNGELITSFTTETDPADSATTYYNSTDPHYVGRRPAAAESYFDGYVSDLYIIDGTALAATNFGELDTNGHWVAKSYETATGTNTCHIADLSTGVDSLNSNDWTVTSGPASVEDSPTNNFCTLLPTWQDVGAAITLSEGNLRSSLSSSTGRQLASFACDNKFYFEVKNLTASVGNNIAAGVWDATQATIGTSAYGGSPATSSGANAQEWVLTDRATACNDSTYTDLSGTLTDWGQNDILMVAGDPANGNLWFGVNGTWSGDPAAGTGAAFTNLPSLIIPIVFHSGGSDAQWDFGCPQFSITSGNADGNGYGNFEYAPPSGFLAPCSANLDTPTIADPSDYFDVVIDTGANIKTTAEALFTGNYLEWIKDRDNSNNHQLIDTVRGTSAVLQSNTTAAETTYSAPSGNSVGWVWKEGATPGFDIVSYTGNATNRTINHNLGVTPELIITKNRDDGAKNWGSWHKDLTSISYYMFLNTTGSESSNSTVWNTAPTSSVFGLGTSDIANANTNDYIAYLFASVDGFCKVGSYEGNGSADGSFIWCGFRPAYVLCKSVDSTSGWHIYDYKREGYNVDNDRLEADNSAAEGTGDEIDFLSNGFKLRIATDPNVSETYIYLAMAEAPFKYANAR